MDFIEFQNALGNLAANFPVFGLLNNWNEKLSLGTGVSLGSCSVRDVEGGWGHGYPFIKDGSYQKAEFAVCTAASL